MTTPKFYFSKKDEALVEIHPLTLTFHFEKGEAVDVVLDGLTFECNGKTLTESPLHGFYLSQEDYENQKEITNYGAKYRDMLGFTPNDKAIFINHNGEPEKIWLYELGKITYDFETKKYTHKLSDTKFYGSLEDYYNYEDYKVIDKDGKETIVEGKYKKFIFTEEQEKAIKALEDARKALNDAGLQIIWDYECEEAYVCHSVFVGYYEHDYERDGYTEEDAANGDELYEKFSRSIKVVNDWINYDYHKVVKKDAPL